MMKALVYEGAYKMSLREVPIPVPAENDVLVRVRSVGICGSDVHGFRGTTGRRKPPIIMGHEFSGVVEAVGGGVKSWKPGDRVVCNPLLTCGVCEGCSSGFPNICQDRHCLGVDLNGAYAEFVNVHERMVCRLPDSMTFDQGSLVEPLAVAMRAANQTDFLLSDTVAIIGCGTIGLLTMLAVRMKGAGEIIMIDTNDHRLAFAKKLGADHALNSQSVDVVEAVRKLSGGKGVSAAIEAVGISATANLSLLIAKNGAHVTWIGNSQPEITVNMQQIVTRELKVAGTYGFAGEFAAALDAIRLRRIDPLHLVEKETNLAEAAELIGDLANGASNFVKVIVKF